MIRLPTLDVLGLKGLRRASHAFVARHSPMSDWVCFVAGSRIGIGIGYRPRRYEEPNRFQRWMHKLLLGNNWVYMPLDAQDDSADVPEPKTPPDRQTKEPPMELLPFDILNQRRQ